MAGEAPKNVRVIRRPVLFDKPIFELTTIVPSIAVSLRNIGRTYGPVRALHEVTLDIVAGSMHGLVGENGAGKSTLMKLLAGLEHPTAGTLAIFGNALEPIRWNPRQAAARGVAMIHQELNLVEELSIADNIFLGREKTVCGWVNRRETLEQAGHWLAKLDFRLDPSIPVKRLSVAQKQMVEIAKAVSCSSRILVLDEPTAMLTAHETTALFGLLRELRRGGTTLIYISHHLAEVIELCDRVTVLRDGEVIRTLEKAEIHSGHAGERQLANLMVGRPLGDYFPPRRPPGGRVVLEVRDYQLAWPTPARPMAWRIRAGEIFGLAGLVGAGRTELGQSLAGLRRPVAGQVLVEGRPVAFGNPAQAMRHGVVYLSEDRRGTGLVLDMSIAANITLAGLSGLKRGWLDPKAEWRTAEKHVRRLGIRISDPGAAVATLSGGNQQKVALAKWLEVNPRVLILDEPTRGLDIGAKKEIYRHIAELAQQGMACLLISSEINELLGLCHRIAVMRHGSIRAILPAAEASEEKILYHAAGIGAPDRPHGKPSLSAART